jgi:hypothetical protein
VNSPRRVAGLAGLLYLLLGVLAGFAEGFVQPKVYVEGDSAVTTENVVANSGLVRIGVVADLLSAVAFIFLALTLYVLLKHVSTSAARAMLVLVAIAVGITCLSAVFEFQGLRVATGSVDMGSLGQAGSDSMVLLLLDTQHNGLLIAEIFMGLWMVPLGYLTYKSGWFPKPLGILLVVGGACYVVDMLAAYLATDLSKAIDSFITLPAAAAEVWMVVYLLLIGAGVKAIEQEHVPSAP